MAQQGDRRDGPPVDETELLEITGDPARARVLRESLERLADGIAGDTLREFATEVLAGRVALRDAVRVPAYGDALVAGGRAFQDEWSRLSEAERQHLAAEGERLLESREREVAAARRAAAERRQDGSRRRPRHDGRGWSPY
ncbi:hypothetical protein GL263_19725 [Streptomyces durbertensis]|uniref:Uncharacterized protein n=1 Tax=Streptomyces durbertensis TaxID=2448886 RepID=A0ABR6EKA4_9ACTN|nr:hypothetical protein [Streptomyces durbertensis]MBB1245769.1 hypothetical protein [Streptomyces durbertensis]